MYNLGIIDIYTAYSSQRTSIQKTKWRKKRKIAALERRTAHKVASLSSSSSVPPFTEAPRFVPSQTHTNKIKSLVKTDQDVTTDACRQVNLSLQVELDTDRQGGGLQVTLIVDGTLEEVAYEGQVVSMAWE